MLAHIIIFTLFAQINSSFLLGNEGWTITGNKRPTEAKHQPYSLGPKMSNYIQGTDDLVNVDFINRDDRNLWYFRSPLLKIPTKTVGIIFTITSFAGNFTNLNQRRIKSAPADLHSSWSLTDKDLNSAPEGRIEIFSGLNHAPADPVIKVGPATFNQISFDGNMQTITVPFIEAPKVPTAGRSASLGWNTPIPFKKLFLEPVVIEILGDWTRGIETVAIDNVEFY